MTVRTIDEIFRDFVTDGVPASGPFNPHKPDIRDTLKALTEGSENFPDNRVIRLNNADEGTANNIVVTASVAIPAAAYQVLYILNVTQENTGPVTVTGAINRDLVTNINQPVPGGYLTPGMALLCIDTGTELRLLSYGDAEAIQAAAEAAAERAEDAAAAAEAAAGGLLSNFASRAEVQVATIPSLVAYVRTAGYSTAGDGGAALYRRVSSEPSHPGKVQSSDGAWWELADIIVNFRMFGAKIDGATDDTAAWNAALDYCFASATAKDLYFPAGFMKLVGPLRDISNPITIRGAGRRNSVITLSGTTGIAVRGMVTRSADVVLHNFSVNGASMTGGDALTIDFAQATVLTDFSVFNPFNGIYMRQMGNAVFNNVMVDGSIRGAYGWKAYGTNTARNGENDQIDVIQFNNCLIQSNYAGDTNVPTAEGLILDGRVHSVNINGLRCLSLLRGFVTRNTPAVASNFAPSFIIGSGLEAENTYAEGLLFAAGSSIELDNVFAARAFRADGIAISTAVGTIEINKAQIGTHYNHGINNQGCAMLTLADVKCFNNSQSGGNTKSGLYLGGSGRTYVRGGTFGKATWLPAYTEPQKYGIDIDPSFGGEIKVDGANLTGNATGPINDANVSTVQTGSYVRGSSGYNPGGVIAKTVPSSGGTISSGLRDEFINVIGGSGVSVQVDGLFVVNSTPSGFMLPARKAATIAYTTAPTMTVECSPFRRTSRLV